MTKIQAGVVDVYVFDVSESAGWRVLLLRRAQATRCPGAWEAVHGRIEEGETPEQAALRETGEETGLLVQRLYNVTVQPFYLHKIGAVQLAVVFAALVSQNNVVLSAEHQDYRWLSPQEAAATFAWPRESAAMREALALLRNGDAGPLEDVLRVF
jgi:8-oxo-dGTP pyrophosphatase MutT (NUDIX family)